MELRECYTSFGGDFDEVLGRLRREQLVEKFVFKFLADKSFQLFEESMEKKDYEEALRGVHTMILSILVDTFISKISLPMQPVPEIGSISGA